MTTTTYNTPMLTIAQYAKARGISTKTVNRMIERLPGAEKDERGRWLIPADASPSGDLVALPSPPTSPRTDILSHPSQAIRTLNYDAMPSFLTIDQAAQLLGISRHAITQHREYFDVVPFGANGSLVVPLATIKRIRG